MIIAIPLTETNEFSPHYGASARVGLLEVDQGRRRIVRSWSEQPPSPEPCSWVEWLADQRVSVLLAGGMGAGARRRLAEAGIEVMLGVPATSPEQMVTSLLAGELVCGENSCEGGHEKGGHGHHEHTSADGGCGCGH